MKGRLHSIESMGLNDGPGVRMVVFFQGCKIRCAYCHNPDTWKLGDGFETTSGALLEKALKFKPYFERSGGGVTCSGGEPLLQPEFLLDFLKKCKGAGLHTALDTAGFGIGRYEEILEVTDLVLLDIKHVDRRGYRQLTGGDMDEFHRFAQAVRKSGRDVWLRHVSVPGMTEGPEHAKKLKDLIRSFPQAKRVEVLPYHVLGVAKYEAMGIPYPLKGVDPMNPKAARIFEAELNAVL